MVGGDVGRRLLINFTEHKPARRTDSLMTKI